MPNFNHYEHSGRKLLVRFTCHRCKKVRTEDLQPLAEKVNDHYGNLGALPLPNGWSDWLIHNLLLCDTCTKELIVFLKLDKEEEKK